MWPNLVWKVVRKVFSGIPGKSFNAQTVLENIWKFHCCPSTTVEIRLSLKTLVMERQAAVHWVFLSRHYHQESLCVSHYTANSAFSAVCGHVQHSWWKNALKRKMLCVWDGWVEIKSKMGNKVGGSWSWELQDRAEFCCETASPDWQITTVAIPRSCFHTEPSDLLLEHSHYFHQRL